MKKLLATLCACTIMPLMASAQGETRYELDVKEFNELKVTDGINVDYVCNPDSAGKAVFFASPQMASQIIFKPSKDKLEIQLVPKEERVNREVPKVTVYSTYLTYVENSGDSLVRIMNVAPGPKFKAKVIGNGRISVRSVKANTVEGALETGKGSLTIFGTCTDAKLSSTGTGNIQADGLEAKDVSCRILGTGSIGCWATSTLSVTGMGSGTVYYKGEPTVKKRALAVKVEALKAD
ncbi:MAG: DUF2807 domain-containing protein [Muribaculaceae bacterium]|nr:DUF2807 domain-containing protein [Muribaculaceae bacterium]